MNLGLRWEYFTPTTEKYGNISNVILGSGPNPFDLLSAALGSCTSMTIRLYARQKNWPLKRVRVSVTHHRPDLHARDLFEKEITIEGTLDEFKTHLRGARMVLRSETPALVRQEVWGLLLAHFAVRGLMHEAALQANEDPDRLSFLHAVRVIRRQLPRFAALPPSAPCCPAPRGAGRNSGRTREQQPWPAEPARRQTHAERLQGAAPVPQPNHQGGVCREHSGA